jgi:hypothetical protein
MDILPSYSGYNVSLTYEGRIFLLTGWHDSGNADPTSRDAHTLIFTNNEDGYLRQFKCEDCLGSPIITYTESSLLDQSTFITGCLMFSSDTAFTLAVGDATKHWDGVLEYSTNA